MDVFVPPPKASETSGTVVYHELKNKFEKYVKDYFDRRDPKDLQSSIKQFFRSNYRDPMRLFQPDFLRVLFTVLLQYIHKHDQHNGQLVDGILHVFVGKIMCRADVGWVRCSYDECLSGDQSFRRVVSGDSLLNVNCRNRRCYENMTSRVVLQGNFMFVQTLIKYGCCIPPPPADAVRDTNFLFQRFTGLENYVLLKMELDHFVSRDVSKEHDPRFDHYADIWGTRATIFLWLADLLLLWLSRKELPHFNYGNSTGRFLESKVNTLNLFFKSTPLPLLAFRDVELVLDIVLKHPLAMPLMRTKCKEIFAEAFPQNPELYQPRSLQHLSRCRIRDCFLKITLQSDLVNDGKVLLPEQVARLNLPKCLKDFVLCSGELCKE